MGKVAQKLSRRIKRALQNANNTDDISKENNELQGRDDIDKETKEKLEKYAKAARHWKQLQSALETAKKELTSPETDGNETNRTYRVDSSNLEAITTVFDIREAIQYGEDYRDFLIKAKATPTVSSKLKTAGEKLGEKIFSSNIKATAEATKQYAIARKVMADLIRFTQSKKREDKRKFEKLTKELPKP